MLETFVFPYLFLTVFHWTIFVFIRKTKDEKKMEKIVMYVIL